MKLREESLSIIWSQTFDINEQINFMVYNRVWDKITCEIRTIVWSLCMDDAYDEIN